MNLDVYRHTSKDYTEITINNTKDTGVQFWDKHAEKLINMVFEPEIMHIQ